MRPGCLASLGARYGVYEGVSRVFSQLALFTFLTLYTVASPFAFMWFHHAVLRQTWDNDLTDWVTVMIYIFSNVLVGILSFMVQEGCCKV